MSHLDLLAAALAHAARGWHVFPLRPDDKRPAFPNHAADRCDRTDPRCRAAGRHLGWETRATTDPDRIRRAWSTRPYGIGLACGPSRLVVVDLDVPKPGQIPPADHDLCGNGVDVFATVCHQHGHRIETTYTVITGRAGSHLYSRHPSTGPTLRNTAGALGWLVDTRAHGGYVVAAGSTVAGRPYTVALDVDPAPLPDWLGQLIAPAPPPARQAVTVALDVDRRGRYVAAAIHRQVTHLTSAPEGRRNHALFTSAVALGQLAAGGALTDDDVTAVLEPAALSIGLRPGEIARTIASGLRVGARQPRVVAA
ncbi:bifunctional DNA primase/polymerase [Micromonospora haikouensis]|uniref:DNA primase n=1 Tax=Micromonospora haikouensis TaxID=686309 RepID=A0A0D0UXD3_9ACTN|nr:bifunctional DNA primase/polymerase [Micromonospora haikouensis]KIR63352.1 DNA primase [Micromonospora haikouensis]